MTQDDEDTRELVDDATVEEWLADYNKEEADKRTAEHADRPPYMRLSEDNDLVGIAGELEFGRLVGQAPTFALKGRGDGGRDFWIAVLYSVDVKTYRKPGHILAKADGRAFCDLYVLAGYDDATRRATLLGWTTGKKLAAAPVKPWSNGANDKPAHYIARGELRDMEEFEQKFRLLKFKP